MLWLQSYTILRSISYSHLPAKRLSRREPPHLTLAPVQSPTSSITRTNLLHCSSILFFLSFLKTSTLIILYLVPLFFYPSVRHHVSIKSFFSLLLYQVLPTNTDSSKSRNQPSPCLDYHASWFCNLMGGSSITQYRASVGSFYSVSLRISTMHMSFINCENIYPILLIYYHGIDGVLPALMLLAIFNYRHGHHSPDPSQIPLAHSSGNKSTTSDLLKKSLVIPIVTVSNIPTTAYLMHSFLSDLLLLLCDDVHPNPGPTLQGNSTNISIVHNNICSLQNKRDNVEAELSNFDIIALSETWLYKDFPSDMISIKGYQKPVRLDRPSDTQNHHGGVAIYVKDHLYCKQRPDLKIPGLESVWIETKINQEPLLKGCIYRPPDKLVHYWDVIDDSIKLALSTPYKTIMLGDLNKDCLTSPDKHVQRKWI